MVRTYDLDIMDDIVHNIPEELMASIDIQLSHHAGMVMQRRRITLEDIALTVDLGEHTLRGEIVDIKCYLGVMKPAHGKPHRSCAARCISGGIPPALVVKDRDGDTNHLLLVSADGRTVNREVLPLVAEPVEITGRVVRLGDRLVLQANPETYRRLTG